MELEDVKSDLEALRKLYSLLQSSGGGVQIARNEILDERARLLLKNLLDGAAERILQTHLKMTTAAHSGVSNTSFSSKPQQPKTMPKLQLPVSPNVNILGASASVIPKANNTKPTTQEVFLQLSRLSVSESDKRKKCCRLCKQSSMQLQRQNSTKIPSKDGNDQDSFFNINGHEKGLVALKSNEKIRQNPSSIVSSIASGKKFQSKEESNFSKQVANTIQRIALAVGDPIKNAAAHDNGLYEFVKINEGTSQSRNVNACITSQATSKYVHGLRVPSMPQKETIRKPVKSGPSMPPPSSSVNKKNLPHHIVMRPTLQDDNVSPVLYRDPSMPPPSSSVHKKNLPHQIIMRPTLLDDHVSPVLYRDRTDKVVPYQQESEDSSSQYSSSTWTTQQTSNSSSSGSEAYSLPTRTRAHGRMGPISKKFSSSGGSYSSRNVGPRDVGPTKRYGARHQTNPTKAIGRLKRFKNKLGLIFLHHHHHHHHHHKADSDHTKPGHNTSTWNNLQKVFHRSNKKQQHEAYGEHAVEKLRRKSTVSNVPRKHQVHALVEGLMRHVRHSKKSKPPKGLRNKKMVKKLHWWQMFQRHGGVKLPNRGRVKLGFKNKKSQLRAQLR